MSQEARFGCSVNDIQLMINEAQTDRLLRVQWNSILFREDFGVMIEPLLDFMSREAIQSSRFASVIKRIIGSIFQGPDDVKCPSEQVSQVFDQVHDWLKTQTSVSQRSSDIIFRGLRSSFPYSNVPVFKFSQFVANYLRTTEYFVDPAKTAVMKFVLDKLLYYDLKSTDKVVQQPNAVFQLDASSNDKEEVANFCDIIVKTLIEFINKQVFNNGIYDPELGRLMFEWFFPIFLDVQINTKRTSSSQFVMFYLVHLDKQLFDTFVVELWSYVTKSEHQDKHRSMAVFHVSSILVRSAIVTPSEIWDFVNCFVAWLTLYADEHDECIDLAACSKNGMSYLMTVLHKHQVFYSIFQSLMVILVEMYHELTPTAFKMLKLLDIQKIINSNLNPLLVCPESLLQSFSAICSSQLQVAACSMVIRGNSRVFPLKSEQFKDFHLWLPYDCLPNNPSIVKFFGKFWKPSPGLENDDEILKTRLRIPSESNNSPGFLHGSSGGSKHDVTLYQDDPLRVISNLD